jgi:hypothetical protein
MKETIPLIYPVRVEEIPDFLDSASRGARYWCSNELGFESQAKLALTENGVEVFDTEGDKETKFILNRTSIARGLNAMMTNEIKHFADFVTGDYDETTGDVFLQCCLFGEVIYS